MRRLITLFAAFATLAVAPHALAATHSVGITKTGFVPTTLTIAQGDQVTWTNQDTTAHQVVSQDAPFSSPVLAPTQTYSYTFTKAGKFNITDPQTKNERMTVTVTATAPAGTVSLNVAPRIVTFGGRVTLSGALSNQKAGEQVTVEAQVCGSSTFTRVTTLTTTTAGAFTYSAQPLKNTAYQVRYKNATSPQATVRVRPRLTLGKIAPRRFTIRARAADSFAGKAVTVQRWNAVTHRWVLARYATLRSSSTGVAPTVVSAVTFTLKVKPRTKLRVVMGTATAGSCYAAPSISNAVLA